MEAIIGLERVIWALLTVCFFYQVVYLLYMLFWASEKPAPPYSEKQACYGIIVPARNEQAVIGQLLDSVLAQTYPREKIRMFVIADNCTDRTAEIARSKGAVVVERFNKEKVGKGYALDYLFGHILETDDVCEAFIVLDADNLLAPNYVEEMNQTFQAGYRIITSYRNSKNYGTNWMTAGYSLWFLRESKFLNNARMMFGTSCAISGTGFLVHRDIIEREKGWKYFLMTEDIQFSVAKIIEGETIGYCERAVLFDEQPVLFRESWNQRLRWSRGFYQVIWKYGRQLLKTAFLKRNFACFDMLMTIFPTIFITAFSIFCGAARLFYALSPTAALSPTTVLLPASALSPSPVLTVPLAMLFCYVSLYLLGLITTLTEWDNIRCDGYRKLLYTFTFPLFLFTYIPIGITALFQDVKWVPIQHNVVQHPEQAGNTISLKKAP